GLRYPDPVLIVSHDRIGSGIGAAGELPLVDLSRSRIVAAELAAVVVAVPDLVVRRDLHPPGPSFRTRQRDFAQLHRRGVDRGDLVRAEQHHPGMALRVQLDAVGSRTLRRPPDGMGLAGVYSVLYVDV